MTGMFRFLPGPLAAALTPTDSVAVSHVLESEEFSRAATQLADQLGRDAGAVTDEAAVYLQEMAAAHLPLVVHAWHRFATWLVRGFQVVTDPAEMAALNDLDRNHALIFLISHRSYLDQFAFPPRLVHEGISPTYGLAGANLDFFPLGPLARRNGFIHVRRASGDMPVYRMSLRALVGRMVDQGHNLVWSIEGGRSRTGKLRPPRYGLLRYVTDAVESVGAERTVVIPVSILYDQLPLHEVKLMVAESRGLPKRPENVRWLVGYARGLRHPLGRIYLNFGSPVPLYDRLIALRAEGLNDRQVVERVALDICHRINRATPVSSTAAVCVAMLGADRALTLDEVCATVAPLADYLRARKCPIAGGLDLTDRPTVARTLDDLVTSGVLSCYRGGAATVWGIGDDQDLIAAVYRNSATHVLVMRAIAELALLTFVQTPGADNRTAWDAALALRELLKFDFFFAARDEFAAELWNEFAIMTGVGHDIDAPLDPVEVSRCLQNSGLLVAHLVLRPFVDAYRVVAEELSAAGDQTVDDQQLLVRCLRLGRQWALQHRVTEESVSGEMFSTATKMARHRGLVESVRGLGQRRKALVAELDDLQRSIDYLVRLCPVVA
ncbi:MAG: glycerol-3-phosphate O-acyltransferase [Mycobacterium sp.]|uniref:1-acyl-sn-glycerol-3-phosphate acyltransferase n=1 Tax=Mycobacterium sp. TaxID=1785 RepID=UPI0028BAB37F|nr:1-acyl-sn-glycerol-3-phosphate acyltransferase [Mycobacterium sp.]MDT5118123.1 glycerol-3-phosphate O-acyltransferase [Mycobacterium sp.]